MAKYYIEVTNLDFPGSGSPNPIRYIFEGIENLERIKEQGRTVAAAQDAEESVSFTFTPPKVSIPIEWLIINGENKSQLTNDKSDGTLDSSGISDDRFTSTDSNGNPIIKTIPEQLLWLRTYIFNGTGGTKFRLYGGKFSDPDGDGSDEGTPVGIENIRLPQNVNDLNAQQGSIELSVGEVV